MATVIPLVALALIVVILFVAWPRRSKRPMTGKPLTGEEIVRANGLVLRDQLSRHPFGEALARSLWQRLMACPVGEGHVCAFHRDFCGHALIRRTEGVVLCDAQDGGTYFGDAIATWLSEAEFVAFFALQSDYSCSGWDAAEPVFATDDEWYRNNQRLTREALEQFIATPA